MGRRWYDETRAAEETEGILSTIAVLRFLSIACTVDACNCTISSPISITTDLNTHINYPTKRSDRICPVHYIAAYSRSILHDAAGHHDHVLGVFAELLDDKVHHLPERGIFVLKQLRDTEKQRGGFLLRELFACEEEEGDFGEEDAAAAGRDWRGIEDAGWQGISVSSLVSWTCIISNPLERRLSGPP